MHFSSKIRWFRKKKIAVSDSDGTSIATTSPPSRRDQTTTVVKPRHGDACTSPTTDGNPSSPSLAIPVNTSKKAAHLPSGGLDLWAQAYEILQDREPELTEDYNKHLASLQDGTDSPKSISVESIVHQLLRDREKKQWRVSLLGKDIVIREQVERLTKFLLWSDSLVQAAVSSQPYAALAWSGASVFLSVGKDSVKLDRRPG